MSNHFYLHPILDLPMLHTQRVSLSQPACVLFFGRYDLVGFRCWVATHAYLTYVYFVLIAGNWTGSRPKFHRSQTKCHNPHILCAAFCYNFWVDMSQPPLVQVATPCAAITSDKGKNVIWGHNLLCPSL
ncbi:uncharacterized protein G2W53_026625 [Senna tora]|uniref:Uncharacterized protein n=1 Tax=Senna tora TaxID=362788 RepID=A0A834THT2_9FABA|nr:uncharacterized protein G2W53_026625 [Senna tora]